MLDRILTTPQLARAVPQLPPELLHHVIRHFGLEDCGELVALATPDQVARLFDLDLWRAPASGLDERFDADRFGTWLEVILEAGGPAIETLSAIDVNLLAAGFAEHVRVFDYAAVAPYLTLDGEVVPGAPFADGFRSEIGGFVVTAKRLAFWDAVTGVLSALSETHGEFFGRVMRECCRLSSSRPETDGLDDLLTTGEQAMFDAALAREARGDARGYVTPLQAQAFLQAARRIDLRAACAPARDGVTSAYFARLERSNGVPEGDDREAARDGDSEPRMPSSVEAAASIVELLHEAGALPSAPRALLDAPRESGVPRLARIHAQLQTVEERSPEAYAMRSAELVYLANIVAAAVTIQSRPLTGQQALDAAIAVCNLGLENWPVRWRQHESELPEDFLVGNDLVAVFQVGWTVLHEEVCMPVADGLVGVLTSMHCIDTLVQDGLERLRLALIRHARAGTPWEARDALEVVAMLDSPSWAALLSLIDQLPTMHAAMRASITGSARSIDADAFEFISDNAGIEQVREFMRVLPARLNG